MRVAHDFDPRNGTGRYVFAICLLVSIPTGVLAQHGHADSIWKRAEHNRDLGKFERAASYYERYASSHPKRQDKTLRALREAATLRRELGQLTRALQNYRTYLELAPKAGPKPRNIARAVFEIGRIYERRRQLDSAAEQYRRFVEEFGDTVSTGAALTATVKLGILALPRERTERAHEKFQEVLRRNRESASPIRKRVRVRRSAARAQFELADRELHRLRSLGFAEYEERINSENGEESKTSDSSDRPRSSSSSSDGAPRSKFGTTNSDFVHPGAKIRGVYERVVEFGIPQWTAAAHYRMGRLYEHQAEIGRKSLPREGDLETNCFRQLCHEAKYAIHQFEKEAAKSYRRALRVARREGWFGEYVRRATRRLQKLPPGPGPPPSEIVPTDSRHLRAGYVRADFADSLNEPRNSARNKAGGASE